MASGLSGWHWSRKLAGILALLVALAVLTAGVGVAVFATRPDLAAQGADELRNVIGDAAVAQLESAAFQAEDMLRALEYRAHPESPAAPWASAASTPVAPASGAYAAAQSAARTDSSAPSQPRAGGLGAVVLFPTATPVWPPAPLAPMGSMQGEGQWTPYLQGPSGQVVAYRTYLQPDPTRPYVVAAIVAFNLDTTRLHFVLGSQEPVSTVSLVRTGRIPSADLSSGLLLAAFNGGFKAQHGHFGAMIDGTVVLPPRDGLGTVALYADGTVRIGAWGTDIVPDPNIVAWRQNGPLIVQNGVINPHTADIAPQDWGYTVNGVTTTWRSALAISADGKTLYYVTAQGITLPVMAAAVADTGAAQAMQLDINNYWVHFEAYHPGANGLQAVPLLNAMSGPSRFLSGYKRDYFYVTALPGQ